jgi:hypothetical protein
MHPNAIVALAAERSGSSSAREYVDFVAKLRQRAGLVPGVGTDATETRLRRVFI